MRRLTLGGGYVDFTVAILGHLAGGDEVMLVIDCALHVIYRHAS